MTDHLARMVRTRMVQKVGAFIEAKQVTFDLEDAIQEYEAKQNMTPEEFILKRKSIIQTEFGPNNPQGKNKWRIHIRCHDCGAIGHSKYECLFAF